MAQGLAVMAGVWLMGLGVLMFIAPRRSLGALAAMGGTPVIHFGEMAIRTVAGLALTLAAPLSRFPLAILITGGFLIASAIVLIVLPRRWHSSYSRWWAGRIPVGAVRVIAPMSALGGAMLIWSLFGG